MSFAEQHGVSLRGGKATAAAGQWLSASGVSEVNLLHRLSDFYLSKGAARACEAADIRFVGELVCWTPSALRGLPNCGRRTVNELEKLAEILGMSLGLRVRGWDRKTAVALSRKNAEALTEARKHVARQRFGEQLHDCVSDEVDSYISQLTTKSSGSIARAWLEPIDGRRPTLQSIGDRFGLTRERVRQVLKRFRETVKSTRIEPNLLREAIRLAETEAPVTQDEWSEELLERWPSEKVTHPHYYVAAADLFGLETDLRYAQLGKKGALVLKADRNVTKRLHRLARRMVEHWGCSTIEELAAEYESKYGKSVETSFAMQAAQLVPGFNWLDAETGWFWIADMSRNRIRNRIDKILSVAPRIHVSELRAGIARHHRMDAFAPPRRVLRAICIQLPDCEVSGDVVEDTRPRDPQRQLSGKELKMFCVLKQHKSALPTLSFERLCDAAGVNRRTFYAYLANSPILRRFAHGVYGLIGAELLPGAIERLRPKRSRKGAVLEDHGWRSDGRLWINYKLSEGAIRNGVLSVPAPVKEVVAGEHTVLTAEGDELATLVVNGSRMWGLLKYFGRRGGEPGDYLTVTFDLGKKQATIELSDEPAD